jgi:dolichyl-phosphate-mannose-protein mannosyltransferase
MASRAPAYPRVDLRPSAAPIPQPVEATAAGSGWLRTAAVVLPILLVLVGGVLRFYRLDDPPRTYFDELYYIADAREYLVHGVETGFAVHPPLGKWLIAGGMAVFGDGPIGWRFAAAAAGTLTVLATYLAGLRLFRRRGIAALAAFLLAIDGLAFTMSRIAMLDMFVALFVVVGFWFLLIDRDRLWAGAPDPQLPGAPRDPPPRPRAFRWLAGIAFGLAVATKWSAVLALGAVAVFLAVSEVAWRRRWTGRPFARPWRLLGGVAGAVVIVPAAVYVASYAGWFANFPETRIGQERCPAADECPVSVPDLAAAWRQEQRDILRFHRLLDADHPYRAPASTWPILARPVAYYYESCASERFAEGTCVVERGNVAEILAIGNPAIWWPALLAYLLLAFFATWRRDWRAWALLAFLLAQYLPWLLPPRPVFFFYMTPVVPFIVLTLAYTAWRATAVPWLRWIPIGMAALAVGGFLFWYPILSGLEITPGAWRLRLWFTSWI